MTDTGLVLSPLERAEMARFLLDRPFRIRRRIVRRLAADHDQTGGSIGRFVESVFGTPFGIYQDSPAEFISEILEAHLWSGQREVADAVGRNRRVSVPSGHDLGKSFLAARILAWWIATRPAGQAMGVSTAPTFNQVKHILWRELARAHAIGNLKGRMNLTEWWLENELGVEEMVAFGRKPADTSPGAFQGIHERWVLMLIDEADEVHTNIWEAASTIVTNELSKMLAIGNPVNAGSEFDRNNRSIGEDEDASGFVSDRGWYVVRLDGLKSPNFTGEPIPDHLRDLLLSPAWVEDYAQRHGRNSQAFNSRVRGIPPSDQADGVIPISWLRDRCRHLTEPPDDDTDTPLLALQPIDAEDLWPADELVPVQMGVDVGAGGDQTVIIGRRGRRVTGQWRVRSPDPQDTHRLLLSAVNDMEAAFGPVQAVKIDAIGWGWGLVGSMREDRANGMFSPHTQIVDVHVGRAAWQPQRFRNLRSQIWWDIGRGNSEDAVWDLSELPDEALLELAEPRYTVDAGGRIVVEPKADTKERIGHSPDDADAVLLCFYDAPEISDRVVTYEHDGSISDV